MSGGACNPGEYHCVSRGLAGCSGSRRSHASVNIVGQSSTHLSKCCGRFGKAAADAASLPDWRPWRAAGARPAGIGPRFARRCQPTGSFRQATRRRCYSATFPKTEKRGSAPWHRRYREVAMVIITPYVGVDFASRPQPRRVSARNTAPPKGALEFHNDFDHTSPEECTQARVEQLQGVLPNGAGVADPDIDGGDVFPLSFSLRTHGRAACPAGW